MTKQTTVLITGANRGIGRGLAEALLSRPNHTVIAGVRDLAATTLSKSATASGSRLITVKVENTSDSDAAEAIAKIKAEGVTQLDLVIANAGINPLDALSDVKDMDVAQVQHTIDVNTMSFIRLFQAAHPLLKAAEGNSEGGPKLLAITSGVSQMVNMEANIPFKVGTYGLSKLALNYLVRRAHFETPWLTAWVMDPGFCQTDNGNATAQLAGLPQAPVTVEQSVTGILARVDGATKEATSGNFYSFDGSEIAY